MDLLYTYFESFFDLIFNISYVLHATVPVLCYVSVYVHICNWIKLKIEK